MEKEKHNVNENLTHKSDEEEAESGSQEQNAYFQSPKADKNGVYNTVKNFFKNYASSKTSLSDGKTKRNLKESNKKGKENAYEDVQNSRVSRNSNKPNESGINELNRRFPLRTSNSISEKSFKGSEDEEIDGIPARNIDKSKNRSFSDNEKDELNDQKANVKDQNVNPEQIANKIDRFTDHAIFKDEAEDFHPSIHDQSIYDIHDQSANSIPDHVYENLRNPNFKEWIKSSDPVTKKSLFQRAHGHVLNDPTREEIKEPIYKAEESQLTPFREEFQQNVPAKRVITNSQNPNPSSKIMKFLHSNVRKLSVPNMHSGNVILLNTDETNVTFSELKSDMEPIMVSTETSKTVCNPNMMSGGKVVLEEFSKSYKLPNIYAPDPIVFNELPDDFAIAPTTRFEVPKPRVPIIPRSFSVGHTIENTSEIITLPDLCPSRKTPPQQQTPPYDSQRSFSGGRLIEIDGMQDKISLDLLSQSIKLEEEEERNDKNPEMDHRNLKNL